MTGSNLITSRAGHIRVLRFWRSDRAAGELRDVFLVAIVDFVSAMLGAMLAGAIV